MVVDGRADGRGGAPGGAPRSGHAVTLRPDYAEWLTRVETTYQAVAYTCRVRLGDVADGEAVAVRVAEGLLARPRVFRYWGLPFSGRIASLAEDAIAAVGRGDDAPHRTWPEIRADLADLAPDEQHAVVLVCVEGCTDEELASALGCDAAAAVERRAGALARLRTVSTGPLG